MCLQNRKQKQLFPAVKLKVDSLLDDSLKKYLKESCQASFFRHISTALSKLDLWLVHASKAPERDIWGPRSSRKFCLLIGQNPSLHRPIRGRVYSARLICRSGYFAWHLSLVKAELNEKHLRYKQYFWRSNNRYQETICITFVTYELSGDNFYSSTFSCAKQSQLLVFLTRKWTFGLKFDNFAEWFKKKFL